MIDLYIAFYIFVMNDKHFQIVNDDSSECLQEFSEILESQFLFRNFDLFEMHSLHKLLLIIEPIFCTSNERLTDFESAKICGVN